MGTVSGKRAVLRPRSRARRSGQQTPVTYKVVGAQVTNFLQAQLCLSGYLKGCPGKSKVGTCGRNPKLRLYRTVQTVGVNGVSHCQMPGQ